MFKRISLRMLEIGMEYILDNCFRKFKEYIYKR